jgi:hypothetical protein
MGLIMNTITPSEAATMTRRSTPKAVEKRYGRT